MALLEAGEIICRKTSTHPQTRQAFCLTFLQAVYKQHYSL